MSGLKLNRARTEGLWVGHYKNKHCKLASINWSNEVKALGIYFGHDRRKCESLNWENKLQQCQRLINHFNTRHITMISRVHFIKTYLLPKFIYLFQPLRLPKEYEAKIDKMFFFLWNGKMERITRSTLVQNYDRGGINMININHFMAAIKLKWLFSFIHSRSIYNWKYILSFVCMEIYYNKHGVDIK